MSPGTVSSASGQRRSDICRDPAILELVQGPACGYPETGREELPAMVRGPEPSFATLPTSQG